MTESYEQKILDFQGVQSGYQEVAVLNNVTVSYTHLTLPTIYSV